MGEKIILARVSFNPRRPRGIAAQLRPIVFNQWSAPPLRVAASHVYVSQRSFAWGFRAESRPCRGQCPCRESCCACQRYQLVLLHPPSTGPAAYSSWRSPRVPRPPQVFPLLLHHLCRMVIVGFVRGDATLVCVAYHFSCIYKHALSSLSAFFFVVQRSSFGNKLLSPAPRISIQKGVYYESTRILLDLQLCWETALDSKPITHT